MEDSDIWLLVFIAISFMRFYSFSINYNIEMQEESIQRKSKVYSRINCCSQGASISQILAIALIVAVQIINFNLLPLMINLKSQAMHVLIGLYFFSFLFVLIEYIRLLVIDPSDPRLQDQNYQSPPQIQLKQCEACQCKVALSSYHCQSCRRCVQQFDHHCTFVNNCIGKNNYSVFIQLLISIIVHTSTGMGISIWLILTLNDSYKWLALTFGALNLAIFLEIAVLAIFHCYISFILYKTTLQVLKGEKQESKSRQIYKISAKTSEQTNINLAKVNNSLGYQMKR